MTKTSFSKPTPSCNDYCHGLYCDRAKGHKGPHWTFAGPGWVWMDDHNCQPFDSPGGEKIRAHPDFRRGIGA